MAFTLPTPDPAMRGLAWLSVMVADEQSLPSLTTALSVCVPTAPSSLSAAAAQPMEKAYAACTPRLAACNCATRLLAQLCKSGPLAVRLLTNLSSGTKWRSCSSLMSATCSSSLVCTRFTKSALLGRAFIVTGTWATFAHAGGLPSWAGGTLPVQPPAGAAVETISSALVVMSYLSNWHVRFPPLLPVCFTAEGASTAAI